MTSLLTVLDSIRRAGGRVWIDAGTIRLRVPPRIIGPDERAVLMANRSILLDLLSESADRTSTGDMDINIEAGELAWFEALTDDEQQKCLARAADEWDRMIASDTRLAPEFRDPWESIGYCPCRRSVRDGIEHKQECCTSRRAWRRVWGVRYCLDCWPPTDPLAVAGS